MGSSDFSNIQKYVTGGLQQGTAATGPDELSQVTTSPAAPEANVYSTRPMVAPTPQPGVYGDFQPSLPKASNNVPWSKFREEPFKRKQLPKFSNGPGSRMFNYLTFRKFVKEPKFFNPAGEKSPIADILTQTPEALRAALQVLGISGENNPPGLGLNIDTARKIWFGENEVTDADEAEFRSMMGGTVDSKAVRQFVNHDGSTTWEVMNQDKTVMSRFTLGEHKGKKLFVQGGYSAYAQELRKLAQQLQGSDKWEADFNRIRSSILG